jgi:hypothetical protein
MSHKNKEDIKLDIFCAVLTALLITNDMKGVPTIPTMGRIMRCIKHAKTLSDVLGDRYPCIPSDQEISDAILPVWLNEKN